MNVEVLATIAVVAGLLGVFECIGFGLIHNFNLGALTSFTGLTTSALTAKVIAGAEQKEKPSKKEKKDDEGV